MSETSASQHQTAILRLFQRTGDGRISAADLKRKLAQRPKGRDPVTADQASDALSTLVERGFLRVSGGDKEGDHPRPKASYRLTDEGRTHLRPARPEGVSDSILEAQRAFILLQLARSRTGKLTRSELNSKLRSNAVKGQLELDVAEQPEALDYHMEMLAARGAVVHHSRGPFVSYEFVPEQGMSSLASATQYDSPELSFTITATFLNSLLAAARGVAPAGSGLDSNAADLTDRETDLADEPRVYAEERAMTRDDIHAAIAELRRGAFRGEDLVPIHEVRRWVGQHLGADAASHARFDPLLMEMRSDRDLKLIAISDRRMATYDEVRDAIPGENETLFYINFE